MAEQFGAVGGRAEEMQGSDDLFSIKNEFYLGNYQARLHTPSPEAFTNWRLVFGVGLLGSKEPADA